MAALIAQHDSGDLGEAVADAMGRIEGAFAAVVLSERALAGFRDPDGIRPLVVGRLDDALGARLRDLRARHRSAPALERELEPGELVVIDERRRRATGRAGERGRGSLCVFEYIYFARPDSVMGGRGAARGARGGWASGWPPRRRSRPTS